MSTETFKKRQKENARREKQKLKLARKIERKNGKVRGEGSSYDDDLELVPQNAESESANSESGVHEESSH
jgi:hypothetical protein